MTDISHDFDFYFHHWRVSNRRLKKRLQGSDDWEEFEATLRCRPALGGLGNTDELIAADGTPMGMTIRCFDREKQQWSIYWIAYRKGTMEPPVHGTFSDGTGIFEGDDVWEGTPIRVRFIWSETNTPTPRWEQAFSTDGGKTWEVNWISTYEKIED